MKSYLTAENIKLAEEMKASLKEYLKNPDNEKLMSDEAGDDLFERMNA